MTRVIVAATSIYGHVARTRILKRSGGSVDHDELEAMVGGFPASVAQELDVE